MTNHSNHFKLAGDMGKPVPAPFANRLRRDDGSVTLVDDDGSLTLVPDKTRRFDVDLARKISSLGLSEGQVVTVAEYGAAIRYPAHADFVGLPAIMNAAIQAPDARVDIVDTLTRAGKRVAEFHRSLGAIPLVTSVDQLVVDRTSGVVEFLPPYDISNAVRPVSVLDHLQGDAEQRSRSAAELDMIRTSFAQAREAFLE